MSAFSTLNITRHKARNLMLKGILEADDETLAGFMDEILRDRLYNVRIVNDDDENDNERLPADMT